MMPIEFTRLAPSGSTIELTTLVKLLIELNPEQSLREAIKRRFNARDVTFHASGREAMRVALCHLAEKTGRREVVVPAYCCFSIPASVVAAGLQVRLADVDLEGQVVPASLAELPLERACGLVIPNLFGRADPLHEITALAQRNSTFIIDDAAQAFGGRDDSGFVGGRSELGILSFGRAKPLSALGGGAVVWRDALSEQNAIPARSRVERLRALSRAIIYNFARLPVVFKLLSCIPQLGIGTTQYNPNFTRGAIDRSALRLAAALVTSVDSTNLTRKRMAESLAREISAHSAFQPLVANVRTTAVYPRLGVLAPDHERRDSALERLRPLGATGMYPTTLHQIRALQPHLVGETCVPVAEDFCRRLFTLPVHSGLNDPRRDKVAHILKELS